MTLRIDFDLTQCACAHDISNRLILKRRYLAIEQANCIQTGLFPFPADVPKTVYSCFSISQNR